MTSQNLGSILTTGISSSMKTIRITENDDKSMNITFIDDKSNGYRSFQLDAKDWESFKLLIDTK